MRIVANRPQDNSQERTRQITLSPDAVRSMLGGQHCLMKRRTFIAAGFATVGLALVDQRA